MVLAEVLVHSWGLEAVSELLSGRDPIGGERAVERGDGVPIAAKVGPHDRRPARHRECRRLEAIVLRDPERPRQYLVKRLGNRTAGGYEVHGDNPNVSRDSRDFGAVPRTLLVGRVIYTYGRR